MGLFSSKYVHNVGTTIQKMVENDKIVDPYKLAVLESTMSKVDLVDNLLETGLNSTRLKARNFYALVDKLYPNKLPTGEMVLDSRFVNAIEPVLNRIHPNKSISIQYVRFGLPNAYHEAWKTLVEQHGYNPLTGVLGKESSETVKHTITSIGVELPSSMKSTTTIWEVDNWAKPNTGEFSFFIPGDNGVYQGFNARPVSFDSTNGKRVRVDYIKQTIKRRSEKDIYEADIFEEDHKYFPITNVGNGKEYYHVLYTVDGKHHFYTYEFGYGIVSLDSVFNNIASSEKIGEFYPNIYFRLNKQETTDVAYKKMAKKLDLDFKDLSSGIHKNESIGDIESALFSLGLNADTTESIELSYCFDFFDQLWEVYRSGNWSTDNYMSSWTSGYKRQKSNSKKAIKIIDDVFSYALTFESITRKSQFGKIGSIGFTQGGKDIETRTKEVTTALGEGDVSVSLKDYQVPYRWYKKQIASNIYVELRVYDLAMVYKVFEEYQTTLGDDDKEICLIPLDKTLVEKYKPKVQDELYVRAYNFIFNSHTVQKLAWYQTGWFKALLTIAAIVVTIYTGINLGAELAAVYATSGAVAAMVLIAQKIVISVAISFGMKIFVKVAGPELAFIAAIAATIAGVFRQNIAMLTPDKLLSLSTAMFKGITDFIKTAYSDLKAEMDSFLSLKTEKEKELDKANDLLGDGISPFASVLLGESPEQFLYRNTVFVTSGFTQLNAVDEYAERALELPRTVHGLPLNEV